MKICLTSPSPATLDAIRAGTASYVASTDEVMVHEGGFAELQPLLRKEACQLLVAQAPSLQDMPLLESLCLQQPGLNVILLAESMSPEVLLQAMRAGAREVLTLPVEESALQAALARVLRRMGVADQASGSGQVCVFMPVRGGVGATLLATNLGYALAAEHGKRVILIDLNLPFGEAEVYIGGERAQHCLADVTEKTAQLDEAMLNSVLVKPHPKMGILATGDQLDRSVAITPEQLGVVINTAAQMADYVFLDVSSTLNGLSLAAMDRSSMIVPVLEASFPVIRNAKRMTELFRRLGYSREKILPVVNRYDSTGQITSDDIVKALDLKTWQVLPDRAETAFASLNQGVPLMQLRPRDPLTRRILDIAQEMATGTAVREGARKEAEPAAASLTGRLRSSLGRWAR